MSRFAVSTPCGVQTTAAAPSDHPHDDGASEAMSTSTISKAEETNRMADIENSFEDR